MSDGSVGRNLVLALKLIALVGLIGVLVMVMRAPLPSLPASSQPGGPYDYTSPHTTPATSGITHAVTDCGRFGDRGAPGTLGAALTAAGAGDTIRFQCSGHLHLAPDAQQTQDTAISLSHDLLIDATGYDVTLDGDGRTQVFYVTYPAAVALTHLTITGGQARAGGGLFNDGSSVIITDCAFAHSHITAVSGDDAEGGAILNRGTMTIIHTTFEDNTALGKDGFYGSSGGAIANGGTVTISESTFSGNRAGAEAGDSSAVAGPAEGGAIWNGGTLTLDRDTLTGNTARSTGDFAQGGAIYNDTSGKLAITNSTLFGNQSITTGSYFAQGGALSTLGEADINYSTLAGNAVHGGTASQPARGGAIVNTGALRLRGTLLATSGGAPNCEPLGGTLRDLGHNQDDGASCGFSATHLSFSGVRAGLAASPGANGGPTLTLALLPGSPARDAGGTLTEGCPNTDQRGVARPQGAACDIGAYEAAP